MKQPSILNFRLLLLTSTIIGLTLVSMLSEERVSAQSRNNTPRNRKEMIRRVIVELQDQQGQWNKPQRSGYFSVRRGNNQPISHVEMFRSPDNENLRYISTPMDTLTVYQHWLTLLAETEVGKRFRSITTNSIDRIGSEKGIAEYRFPCAHGLGEESSSAIQFDARGLPQFQLEQKGASSPCSYRKLTRLRDQRSSSNRTNSKRTRFDTLYASASKDLQSVLPGSSSPGRALVHSFHCTALSDLGTDWGVYASRPGMDDQVGWNLFSPDDPCARAIQNCESKTGLRCSIVNIGEQPISGKEIMVSLQCLNQHFLPRHYAERGRDVNIPALLEKIVGDANEAKAHSCMLEVSDLDTVIVSPSQFDALGGALIEAKVESGKIITTTIEGEATVLSPETVRKNPGPNKSEKIPKNWQYIYDEQGKLPVDCKPIPPETEKNRHCYKIITWETRQEIVNTEPVKPIRGPILRRDDVWSLLTVTEKRINPWGVLGFYLDFQQDISRWRAIAERRDFRVARKEVRRRDPKLALAYVQRSLRLLQQQNPTVGQDLLSKVSTYRAPVEKNLVVVDLAGVAGLNTERNTLNPGETLEQFVREYVQECQKLNRAAISCSAPEKVTINEQDAWRIRTNVTLEGAFGAVEGGNRLPEIGAGQMIHTLAKEGQPVEMVQVTYFIPDYAKTHRNFFVIDFTTTQNREKGYQETFTKIIQSFRFITSTP